MTIEERLIREHEADGQSKILLLKEGTFWKAYEQSAYYLHRQFGFKPSAKFIKKVGQTIVSVGFPLPSLVKFFPQTSTIQDTTEIVYIGVSNKCSEQFEAWKAGLQVPDEDAVEEMLTPRYENLPVFKAVYDVLMKSLTASRHFAKDYRYSLGEDMKRALFAVLLNVYRANKQTDKQQRIASIEAAEEKMMEVRLLCRILNDSKQMPKNLYAQMAFDMVEVDKHLANWKRYQKETNRLPQPPQRGGSTETEQFDK